MTERLDKKRIRQVFRNVRKHRHIEQLIRQFSSNRDDIRKTALNQANLCLCREVLELGCAFGAFTEALKNRLHPQAFITGLDMIAEYESFFMDACARAGYPGRFSSAGVEAVTKLPNESFDLIICSYALYFFVEMIPEIARILKKDGIFITITHDESNMQELIHLTRATLKEHRLLRQGYLLPIEVILRQFSANNGQELLKPYFGNIRKLDFQNTLVFQPWEIYFFVDYYEFKSPFFLTGTDANNKEMVRKMLYKLQDTGAGRRVISMSKNDAIFICTTPFHA